MMFFVLFLQCALPNYSVTVDPVLLTYLYQHPQEDIEIPATISLDTLVSAGTLAFRGGTSLYLDKKSWHITLDEDDLFPCGGHILLNAQFRDASLMRNSLGMLLTRKLGFPAPETEFVTLSINGDNKGVFERVERIDRLFYLRNGTGFGPLFKSVDTQGRLVCHYSDTSGTTGFEPKVDSEPYNGELIALIENCFRGDVSSLETEEFLALFAVNTAISDRDGVIKNVYLHLWNDSWHIYPWDRDATFGNSWTGEYIPGWTEQHSLSDFGYSGSARALLESWDNVQLLNLFIARSAAIMAEEYPHIIDSIRLEIRSDLAQDPLYEYSISQFDSICSVLSRDIEDRAAFLSTVYLADPAPSVTDFHVSPCLDMEDELEIELELEGGDPEGVILLVSFNGEDEEWLYMPEDGKGDYEYELAVPPGTYSVRFAFGPRLKPWFFPVFFPSWSFRGYNARPVPAPGARVALAPLVSDMLSPGTPLWCGENLWVLPVTNTGDFTQDLSLCSFYAGSPSGTVFFPESVLVQSGETFHLTNNASLAAAFCSGQVFGDAGTPYPAGTPLFLNDPSWHEISSWSISRGDSLPKPGQHIIPTEISRGNGTDWVELYNFCDEPADLSGWYMMDSDMNTSFLPDGTLLCSGAFLVLCADPGMEFPDAEPVPLDFHLSRQTDTVSLFNITGDSVFSLGWDESWPGATTGIMYLKSPLYPVSSPCSWLSAEPPGTPGSPNPGWQVNGSFTSIGSVYPNPCSGAFSFSYESSSFPVEAVIYDVCGRVISRLDLPPASEGTVTADFSASLPSGVYIVYLRSNSGSDSARFTVLREVQ